MKQQMSILCSQVHVDCVRWARKAIEENKSNNRSNHHNNYYDYY